MDNPLFLLRHMADFFRLFVKLHKMVYNNVIERVFEVKLTQIIVKTLKNSTNCVLQKCLFNYFTK